MIESNRPWYRELTTYHWFVFVVAALGWLFDTMDQQLFNLARASAMQELVAEAGKPLDEVRAGLYGTWATAIFLMGWATGGLLFGVLGDRFGRAKVMMWTILVYSVFTGISAFSRSFWDFAVWRFLTGLGVGGEFAVGVALVAEVMPEKARQYALGLLQALSAVGNVTAALISLGLGEFEETLGLGSWKLAGFTMTRWRVMFLIGTVPALLCIVIRQRLKEPERWKSSSHDDAAQRAWHLYRDLFSNPLWRKRALLGMILASAGVIGLWGIGFFAFDLNRSVFLKLFEAEARSAGEATKDRQLIRGLISNPESLGSLKTNLKSSALLSLSPDNKDATAIWEAIWTQHDMESPVSAESVLSLLDKADEKKGRKAQSENDRTRRSEYLGLTTGPALSDKPGSEEVPQSEAELKSHIERVTVRSKEIGKLVIRWIAFTSLMLNLGAFLGIYAFSLIAARFGRRTAFAIAFLAAGLSTAYVFMNINAKWHVFTMIPVMGFCQLSVFGGYAIYFPELFPTRLRSTGTSFCYNVGRFVAALGPFTLGALSTKVFHNSPEPYRESGAVMCLIFLLGIVILPFCPETKGQPLPD